LRQGWITLPQEGDFIVKLEHSGKLTLEDLVMASMGKKEEKY